MELINTDSQVFITTQAT